MAAPNAESNPKDGGRSLSGCHATSGAAGEPQMNHAPHKTTVEIARIRKIMKTLCTVPPERTPRQLMTVSATMTVTAVIFSEPPVSIS